MLNHFDEVAKSMASGLSRRQALVRLGGLFGVSCIGWLGLGSKVRAANYTVTYCTTYCGTSTFPRGVQRDLCLRTCERCDTKYSLCGTSGATLVCCKGTCCNNRCTSTATDVRHCGACGVACATGAHCVNGT